MVDSELSTPESNYRKYIGLVESPRVWSVVPQQRSKPRVTCCRTGRKPHVEREVKAMVVQVVALMDDATEKAGRRCVFVDDPSHDDVARD
jgi:hypothetical protein